LSLRLLIPRRKLDMTLVNHNISMRGVRKSFSGIPVLQDLNIEFKSGEIHILCGENGAGKSTLVKLLTGLYTLDEGDILLNGEKVIIRSPRDSSKLALSIVYQETNMCPTVSVAENLFLNREPGKLFVNRKILEVQAKKYLELVGLNVDPNSATSDLSNAEMQLLQIAQALSHNSKFIIFDEPTSSLTIEESERFFMLLNNLRNDGVGIIYIDHRIDDFKKIGDTITVLRDGKKIVTSELSAVSKDEIIKYMVGREIHDLYPQPTDPSTDTVLSVRHMQTPKLKGIEFELCAGEILGLGGLVGAGRSEIIRSIFGLENTQSQLQIQINGKTFKKMTPRLAIQNGIGYVPEDRRTQGLVLFQTVYFNLTLAFLDLVNKGPFVFLNRVKDSTNTQIKNLQIKVLDPGGPVSNLSGGNQQKVLLGKWVMNDELKILLLDEPTRGVDIGVKAEIYKLINKMASRGVAILLVTSELPELMGLSNRIAVVRDGEIREFLTRSEYSQKRIIGSSV
jgi:ABC-type sugar transport system ATPase subunit